MTQKSSNSIPPLQEPIDPYKLISILNKKLKSHSQSTEWYKKMYETAEYEKQITLNELKKKKQVIENLKVQWVAQKEQRKDYELELEQLRSRLNRIERMGLSNTRTTTIGQKQSMTLSPYSRVGLNLPGSNQNYIQGNNQYTSTVLGTKNHIQPFGSQLSLQLKHSTIYNILNPQYVSRVLQEKSTNRSQLDEFVPCDIKLVDRDRTHKSSFANSSSSQSFLNMSGDLMGQTVDQPISEKPAEFFVEDFLVFGPDVSQLRKRRQENSNAQELNVKPAVLYAGNSKTHNQHVYTEIATRCYPFGSKVKRQFVESYQQLKDVIEFTPSNKLSNDCFILNLKGQPSQTARNSKCFKHSNLNEIEYVICLRLPDFVWLTKGQKHYQRPEKQIWIMDKFYSIVTYYPIIDIHINILHKIHTILMKEKLQKILVQKEMFYSFDIRKNMLQLEKSEEVKGIIDHFKSYKPDLGEVLFFKGHYYGTFPPMTQAECYVAKLTAPIFMTTFSFEQMLLLLIGLFCQKSIVLISKDESVATLCALFLINILSPFPYSFSVLLNVDQQKIIPFVFEYPFPMVSTIKKTQQNLHQILESYACARIQKKGIKEESERMILVDIDTNSIFYQGHQSFEPLIAMSRPNDDMMQEYMKVNPSYSKSYSFPKKMDQRKEPEVLSKRTQQRNKIIEDMEHTIKSHVTKLPTFQMNSQIHKTLMILTQYIRSYVVDGRDLTEALDMLREEKYVDILRRSLIQRHPTKAELVEKIIKSQYYADYLNLFVQ